MNGSEEVYEDGENRYWGREGGSGLWVVRGVGGGRGG